jgi:hypothetical protein
MSEPEDLYTAYKNAFFEALPTVLTELAEYYTFTLRPQEREKIVGHMLKLFEGNKRRVTHQIMHLMRSMPGNNSTTITFGARYGAMHFADTVMLTALQEAREISVDVKESHALMAIRDTRAIAWEEVNDPRERWGDPVSPM